MRMTPVNHSPTQKADGQPPAAPVNAQAVNAQAVQRLVIQRLAKRAAEAVRPPLPR